MDVINEEVEQKQNSIIFMKEFYKAIYCPGGCISSYYSVTVKGNFKILFVPIISPNYQYTSNRF